MFPSKDGTVPMTASRRVASNAVYLAMLTAANYLLGLLIFPFLSRVLSIDVFGLVGFSMAYVIIFQVIVEYGFMISATADISRLREDPIAVSSVLSKTMVAKACLVVASLLIFVATGFFIPMVQAHFQVVLLFLLAAIVTALIPDFYFRGIEKMRSIAMRAVASKLLALLLILLLVRGDSDVSFVPLALLAGNMLAVVAAFWVIFADGLRAQPVSYRAVVAYLRDGFGFFASRAAAAVNQAAGAFVLGLHYSPASAALGLFSGASRISSAGELAVIPLSDAMYPHMVRNRDYSFFWKVYWRALVFWFLGCATVFVFAEQICVLILGANFADAGQLLRILSIGVFVAYSSNLFGYVALSPIGLSWHANFALVVGALVASAAYLVLSIFSMLSPASVCTVMVFAQCAIFAYRFSVFMANRRRWGTLTPA